MALIVGLPQLITLSSIQLASLDRVNHLQQYGQAEAGHCHGKEEGQGRLVTLDNFCLFIRFRVHESTDSKTGQTVVSVNSQFYRPAEVDLLIGDPSKAERELGWKATTTLEELVAEMVATDKEEAKKEATLKREGFAVVGSMENPPTNAEAIKAAGGKA